MLCLTNENHGASSHHIGHDVIVTCILLLLCLIFSLAGNIWILMKFGRASTKRYHQGDTMLPRSIAILGLIHALFNIPVYMTSIIAGRWLFGTAFCQLFGLITSVTLGTWMWFLALASMERFFKIVVPNEYSSMFSDINTKILLWGTVLFVGMVFTGPIYGWAEYSDKRGAVNVLLISQPKEPDMMPPLRSFFVTHSNDTQLQDSLLQNITAFFQTHFHAEARLTKQIPNGFEALLRSASYNDATCIWNHIKNKSIDNLVWRFFGNSEGLPEEDRNLFTVQMEENLYRFYIHRTLSYQESVTCGLDFSQVNKHIYSFLGFYVILLLLIPVFTNGYFFTRILCSSSNRISLSRTHRRNMLQEKEIFISYTYAISTVLMLTFQVTFLIVNILGGLNRSLPKWAYLTAHLLLYACSGVLPLSIALLRLSDFINTVLGSNKGEKRRTSVADQTTSLTAKKIDETFSDLEMVNLCAGGVVPRGGTGNGGGTAGAILSSDSSACDSGTNPNTTEATILIANGNMADSTNTSSNYYYGQN